MIEKICLGVFRFEIGALQKKLLRLVGLDTDFLIDGRRIGCLEGPRITAGGLELGTQVTPYGWIFWTIILLI